MEKQKSLATKIFSEFQKRLRVGDSFIKGGVAFLPLALILMFAYTIARQFDAWGMAILETFLAKKYIFPYFGLLLMISIVYLAGRRMVYEEESGNYILYRIMQAIPVIGKFFVPGLKERGQLWQPCLYWDTPTKLSLGISAGTQKIDGLSQSKVVVSTINPPPAPVAFLDKEMVILIGISLREAIQVHGTYGTSRPEIFKPIPWEDETREECLKRIQSCPLYQ